MTHRTWNLAKDEGEPLQETRAHALTESVHASNNLKNHHSFVEHWHKKISSQATCPDVYV